MLKVTLVNNPKNRGMYNTINFLEVNGIKYSEDHINTDEDKIVLNVYVAKSLLRKFKLLGAENVEEI